MRKLLRLFAIFTLSLIPLGVFLANAHPLDVSNTTLTIYPDSIVGVTYFHPVELDRILVLSGWVNPDILSVDTYYAMTWVLTWYLDETLFVENKWDRCTMGNYQIPEWLMIDELFQMGLPISYTIVCSEKIVAPIITINICNEVQLQTNRLYIYESDGGPPIQRDYRVLNINKNSHTIVLGSKKEEPIDTDGDWVGDEDELLYRTSPTDQDTDHDGYSDKVEIDASWNPLSPVTSPWQIPFEQKKLNEEQETLDIPIQKPTPHTLAQDTIIWWWARFSQILTQIRLYIDDHGSTESFFLLYLSVFLLGFIHAIGPGHSKGILVSQILDTGMTYKKSVVYSGIFSLVHILDIIVVVVISKYFLKLFDPGKYLGTIQLMSIYLILIVSVYLLISSVLRYIQKKNDKEKKQNPIKKWSHILLAIISWLTPCAFGWSIFLLLFAVKRTDLALPLLSALGLGIFACLFLITTVTHIMKDRIYRFSPNIGMFSPIISSVFLLCIGSVLLFQVY